MVLPVHCSSARPFYFVHACGVRVVFVDHGALGICKSPDCPPARSAGRYSRNSTEESHLSSSTSSLEPPALSRAVRAASCDFSPKSKEDTARETVGPDSHRDPEAWCSRTGTLQARTAEAWCSRTGTLQAQIPNTASGGLAPSAFDPSLEYSTDLSLIHI